MATPKTTTQKENKMATPKTEWTLVNNNKDGDEYSIKYKGNVFIMRESFESYSNFKHIHLYIIKDFQKTLMTKIFSFEYINSKYGQQTSALFEKIKINYPNEGQHFALTPWKEIGKKAIAYIDALSND